MLEILPATDADLAEACALYNHYVVHSIATFHLSPLTVAEFAKDFLLSPNQGLVARDESGLMGFVSLGPFIHREAAAKSAEIALYLREDSCGRGLGPRLLEAGHALAKTVGLTSIIAVITRENRGSCAFFERCGYQYCGELANIAHKLEQDLGVSYYQLAL